MQTYLCYLKLVAALRDWIKFVMQLCSLESGQLLSCLFSHPISSTSGVASSSYSSTVSTVTSESSATFSQFSLPSSSIVTTFGLEKIEWTDLHLLAATESAVGPPALSRGPPCLFHIISSIRRHQVGVHAKMPRCQECKSAAPHLEGLYIGACFQDIQIY